MVMADGDDARLSELRAGRDLYINKCSGCHALYSADRYNDETWTSEVLEMVAKKEEGPADQLRPRPAAPLPHDR